MHDSTIGHPVSLPLKRSVGSKLSRKNFFLGLLFISPWIIGFGVFTLYPFLASFYYSFTKYNIIKPATWVGFKNYQNLLIDPKLSTSIGNTLYYTVLAVPVGIVLALLLALLYNQKIPGRALMRSLIYVPLIVPTVATAILWLWIFNPQIGLLNAILSLFGVRGPAWLADPDWAKISLVIMAQWGVGGNVVLLLAGLQDVPQQLYESAEIDGAGSWAKFWYITLPMLSPTLLFILITGIIYSLQYFTEAFIVSQGTGGPANSTLFYSLYLFQQAFQFFNMGYASAMAWLLFIVTLVLTLVMYLLAGNRVSYDRI